MWGVGVLFGVWGGGDAGFTENCNFLFDFTCNTVSLSIPYVIKVIDRFELIVLPFIVVSCITLALDITKDNRSLSV